MKKISTSILLVLVCLLGPRAFAQITGDTLYCTGWSDTLHGLPAGGTWSSSNPAVATINSIGIVTGISPGTSIISYSLWGTSMVISVNPMPAAITGPTYIPCGTSATLTDVTPGGTWSSNSPAVATIGATTGIITPVSYGGSVMTYTTAGGCYRVWPTYIMVSPSPSTSGGTMTCLGGTIALTGTPSGGTWSSSGAGIATVSSGGVVTGSAVGFDSVLYTISTGCGPVTTSHPITVTSTPSVGIMYGASVVYCGSTENYSCSVAGGTWTSSTPSVATVGASTGIVTGVATGTSTITYTAATGCGTASATRVVTVMPVSAGIIWGATSVTCGATTTIGSSIAGGVWTSSVPTVASVNPTTGLYTGLSAGTTTMTYTMSTSCGVATTTAVVTVTPGTAGTISGPSTVCVGSSATMTSTIPGGTWSTSGTVASVGASTGVVTGISGGAIGITYTVPTACGPATSTMLITVTTPMTGPLGGPSTATCGSTITKTCSPSGGTWTSSSTSVLTITSSSGFATAVSAGTATVTYTVMTACGTATTTGVITVATPTLTATATPMTCSPAYSLLVTGAGSGTSYVWTPATALSCTSCIYPTATPTATTTYTVTGCGVSTTVTVNANRIHGHITFSGTAPAAPATSKVWLIQFNPLDSSIVASDSTTTCYDSSMGLPYYQFLSKPAGNYLVKAKLLASVPGTSGYIPTYGLSTPNWFSATNIGHAATSANIQDINMIYGTVPSGTGFISGYVYAGAGKGTSTGVARMLVYLKNTTGQVLTYTYTDASGAYSFNGLAAASYIIYPEDYDYYTTPSSTITLTSSAMSKSGVTFRQFSATKTIVPAAALSVATVNGGYGIMIHPNPTSGTLIIGWEDQAMGNGTVIVTDMVGREVYRSALNINTASGQQAISLDKLSAGSYIISVRAEGLNYTEKLLLNR